MGVLVAWLFFVAVLPFFIKPNTIRKLVIMTTTVLFITMVLISLTPLTTEAQGYYSPDNNLFLMATGSNDDILVTSIALYHSFLTPTTITYESFTFQDKTYPITTSSGSLLFSPIRGTITLGGEVLTWTTTTVRTYATTPVILFYSMFVLLVWLAMAYVSLFMVE